MYMFLPFLLALLAAAGTLMGKRTTSYVMWVLLLIVTVLSFQFHATDTLPLSF